MLNPNPSHKYDWIRIMQGRKLKHILNRQMFLLKCFAQMFFAQMFLLLLNNKCQLAVPGVLHFWHHVFSRYISQYVFLKVSQNIFLKMYSSKCLKIYFSNVFLKICALRFSRHFPQNMCIAVWHNVFSRYVSQNVFLKNVFPEMYFPKCIPQNVSRRATMECRTSDARLDSERDNLVTVWRAP